MLYNICSIYFPYCLKKHNDGWVILNREYVPVGLYTAKDMDYDGWEYPLKFTRKQLDALNGGTSAATLKSVYLYSDGTNPRKGKQYMKSYLQKLEILMLKEPIIITKAPYSYPWE